MKRYRSKGMERGRSEEAIVSSAVVEVVGPHARVNVFSRGALAGTLVVNKEDEAALISRLLPPGVYSDVEEYEALLPTRSKQPDASKG